MRITRAPLSIYDYSRVLSNGILLLSYSTQAAVAAANSTHQILINGSSNIVVVLYDVLLFKAAAGLIALSSNAVARTTNVVPFKLGGNNAIAQSRRDAVAIASTKLAE